VPVLIAVAAVAAVVVIVIAVTRRRGVAAQQTPATMGTVAVEVGRPRPTVAEFHEGLMRSGLFADVKLLIKSNEHDQLGPELYDYEVRCEL